MSTDWFYRFRAPLRADLAGLDIAAIRERAPDRFRDVCFPLGPPIPQDRAVAPCMGPDTAYGYDRPGAPVGVSTEGGELRLGIWCQNLEREADGDGAGPDDSRMALLLGLLSWATEGRPGEVVGCISAEWDHGHAHPLVRLDDGLVRMCRTEERDRDGHWWGREDEEEAVLPEYLPTDLIRIEDEACAEVDCKALRLRHLPVRTRGAAGEAGGGVA